jgi:hypothetical protein
MLGFEDGIDLADVPAGFAVLGGDAGVIADLADLMESAAVVAKVFHLADEDLLAGVGNQFLGEGGPGRVGFERDGTEAGGTIGKGVTAIVAKGDVAGQLMALEEGAHLLGGAVSDFFNFPFGDGEKDGEDEAAEVALGGDGLAAEIDNVEGDAMVFEEFEDGEGIADVAAQAVEFGDDQVFDIAKLEAVEESTAAGAFAHGDAPGGIVIAEVEVVGRGEAFELEVLGAAVLLEFEGIILLVGGDAAVDGSGFRFGGVHSGWSLPL